MFVAANALVVDGEIRANGGVSPVGGRQGMGSGGTVNIDVGTLSGSGFIAANGGTRNGSNNTGGGGGRVAIRYDGAMTLPTTNVTAVGGDGAFGDAGHGTVFFKSAAQALGDLVIDGQGLATPADSTVLGGQAFDDLTLRGGVNAIAETALSVSGALRLEQGSTLTHAPGSEAGLSITAARVEVDATSAIDVSGRGYPGGISGALEGRTLGFAVGSAIGDGGSHGGRGGDDTTFAGQPGGVYGDPKRPTRLGGGGGAGSGGQGGGAGGGAIRIQASDAIVVDGAIRANGFVASTGGRLGMGAGGSVWLSTRSLGGAGVVEANGGTRNGSNNTGRRAVASRSSSSSWTRWRT